MTGADTDFLNYIHDRGCVLRHIRDCVYIFKIFLFRTLRDSTGNLKIVRFVLNCNMFVRT